MRRSAATCRYTDMTDGRPSGPGPDLGAAERVATIAGISARIAAVPVVELERAISESLDDVLLQIDADRWTLVLASGEVLGGGELTEIVLGTVEEALRSPVPV